MIVMKTDYELLIYVNTRDWVKTVFVLVVIHALPLPNTVPES